MDECRGLDKGALDRDHLSRVGCCGLREKAHWREFPALIDGGDQRIDTH